MRAQIAKYAFLAWFGGSSYVTLEVLWRARSHWTMFLMAAFIFVILGLMNEIWSWNLLTQTLVGTTFATAVEFVTGCIVNIQLGWNVWDYSNLPFNLLGQICPQFTTLWVVIVIIAIILDDIIRWKFFNEDRPHYSLHQ